MATKARSMRFSEVSGWSIFVGLVAALLQLVASIAVASRLQSSSISLPALLLVMVGPFATWLLVAAVAIRKRFVFDEVANRLKIQTVVFFVGVGQSRCVPLAEIVALDFGASLSSEGGYYGWLRVTLISGERIEINGQAATLGTKVLRLVSLVNQARAAAGAIPLPRFSCHAPSEPRRILDWLRSVSQ